jgi:thiamine pyrophosphate-dependent acetolactate synthase large subunit-like protein
MSVNSTLERREAVAELLVNRGELLVVTGLGSPSYDVFAAGDNPLNFYLWGAMGSASLIGLGLALAQPDRSVLVITGDGEQLMALGGLATIGARQPQNLSIAVLDNGHYGETGMQQSHTSFGTSLSQTAKACGITDSRDIHDLETLREYRTQLSNASAGPRFATLKVMADNPPRALPPKDGVYLKNRFRQSLGYDVL